MSSCYLDFNNLSKRWRSADAYVLTRMIIRDDSGPFVVSWWIEKDATVVKTFENSAALDSGVYASLAKCTST